MEKTAKKYDVHLNQQIENTVGKYVLSADYDVMVADRNKFLELADERHHALSAEKRKNDALQSELEAARGERDKWRELEHAAIETAGFNAAQLAAANEKLAVMARGIEKWCADCELRHDCIAPNGEPCDLKDALAAAPAPDDERERLLVAWSTTYCGGMYPEHCPGCPERRNCKIHAALHSK